MSFRQKLKKELREVAVTTLCFFVWFGVLLYFDNPDDY
jgi:hypothetical protein